MGAVFISYRRADSEGQARALSLELEKLLGRNSLFMDVDGIALGRDFRQVIQERLQGCDVMLALIGPRWLDASDANGTRLLENPRDFVRQEIAAALKRNILVIPVLLQGTSIPAPDQLPEDLRDLSYRNGFELEHSTWESDVKEMVKRLGLDKQTATAEALPDTTKTLPGKPAAPVLSKQWVIISAAVAIAGIAGLLLYLSSDTTRLQQPETSATDAAAAAPPAAGTARPLGGRASVTNTPLAPPTTVAGIATSGFAFNWPGDDCWDIFRGTEFVAYQCGAKQQALEAGTYTIKGRSAPVFTPFDVVIKGGAPTTVSKGGVFAFKWPGNDCWDIHRGEVFVTYECGVKQQALGAGTYTVKGRHAAVFLPFQIEIKDGASTSMSAGGVFTFNWPGKDCWDILRGTEHIMYQCGTKSQALGAGTYTIKGRHGPVFSPFTIKIADGAQVKAP